jgi:hypothetical protein
MIKHQREPSASDTSIHAHQSAYSIGSRIFYSCCLRGTVEAWTPVASRESRTAELSNAVQGVSEIDRSDEDGFLRPIWLLKLNILFTQVTVRILGPGRPCPT